jgi:hypothetical protein
LAAVTFLAGPGEANTWLAEFTELGKQGKFFFSLNRYLFIADKSSAK